MPSEMDQSKVKNGLVSTNDRSNLQENFLSIKPTLPEVKFCNISDASSEISSVTHERRKHLISNGSGDSTISSARKRAQIPDGGYGWVVVGASLVLSLVADGISFSFGLIYLELLNQFNESRTKTAWIGSLFLAVPLLVGPIMSNLVDKYGCRWMTFTGGLVSGLGFVLASISNSVEMLYVTFGIISGVGLGIGYVTAVVSIAFWFDKNRTFATSIGASGTGIGTFLYAPLTNWLIEKYGWRGATLLLGGTLLNTCICGVLMRDPDWVVEESRLESRSQSVTTFSNSSVCLDEIKKLLETGAPKETVLDTLVTTCNTEANQQIQDPNELGATKQYKSELFLPTFWNFSEIDCSEIKHTDSRRSLPQQTSTEEYTSHSSLMRIPSFRKKRDSHFASSETLSSLESQATISMCFQLALRDEKYESNTIRNSHLITNSGSHYSLDENLVRRSGSISNHYLTKQRNSLSVLPECQIWEQMSSADFNRRDKPTISKSSTFSRHMKKTTPKFGCYNDFAMKQNSRRCPVIRNSNYFKDMRIHRNSINYRGAILNTHRYRLRASSCPNIYRNSMTTLAKEQEAKWYDGFLDIIKSIFDFSLFLDIRFFLFNLSTLLLFIWFIIPYFYITEHLLKYEYSEESSAFLISVIGISSTIGMVVLGFIGDRPWLNVPKTYGFCLVFCGISVALIPILSKCYACLIVLCTIFGITFASSFSFTPSILVSIVNLEDFTCAYGLVLLVQGIGSLVGPPLAAFIYEVTLRWDDSFYAAGFFIAISGVLAYLVAVLESKNEFCEK